MVRPPRESWTFAAGSKGMCLHVVAYSLSLCVASKLASQLSFVIWCLVILMAFYMRDCWKIWEAFD
jgi:hypothetical protein